MSSQILFFGQNKNEMQKMTKSTQSNSIFKPIFLEGLESVPIKQITSGNYGTLILNQNGEIIEAKNLQKIQKIPICEKIGVGFEISCCLTENGKVYGNYSSYRKEFELISKNMKEDEVIIDITCGANQMYFINQNGDAYGVGNNFHHQLDNTTNKRYSDPVKIQTGVEKVFSGNFSGFTFFLLKSGEVFACGENQKSQLGLGFQSKDVSPAVGVQIPRGVVQKISTGFEHSVLLLKENTIGQLYSCGNWKANGLGVSTDASVFTKISFFDDKNVCDIESGSSHNLVLTKKGKVFTFGLNPYGQLGIGKITRDIVEVEIDDLVLNPKFIHICAGSFSSFVYTTLPHPLAYDLIQILDNQEGCDIQFRTKTGNIEAHQVLLRFRIGEENIPKLKRLLESKELDEANQILTFLYGGVQLNSYLLEEISHLRKFDKKLLFETFCEDLIRMRQEEKSKDFVIKSNGKRIAVHKLILWSRSQLFRGMFLNVNDLSNEVTDYSSISTENLEMIINFMYSNKIESTGDLIEDEVMEQLTRGMDFFQMNEQEPNLVFQATKFFKQN